MCAGGKGKVGMPLAGQQRGGFSGGFNGRADNSFSNAFVSHPVNEVVARPKSVENRGEYLRRRNMGV